MTWGKLPSFAVFQHIEQYHLTLNPAKCVFGMAQVKLLGYIVLEKGLSVDPAKIAAIKRMQEPAKVKQIRAFLSISGYYRTRIQNYAHIAKPLVALIKENYRFVWTDAQQRAFDTLENFLISNQIMAHPRPDKEYLLYRDVCDHAVGTERPIVYLSKQLFDSHCKWVTIECEPYGLIHALKTLCPYLWGSKCHCFVDQKPLTSLFTKHFNNTKIQWWSILLPQRLPQCQGKHAVMYQAKRKHRHFGCPLLAPGGSNTVPPHQDQPYAEQSYGLDLQTLGAQQQWTEQHNEESDCEVVNGLL